MGIRRSACLSLLLYCGIATYSGAASSMAASHKEAIRVLANQGAADFKANRYQDALEKFQRAYEAAKVPRLLVWIAKSQVKLGHLVDAYESYRQAVSLEKNDLWVGTAQQEAQQEAQRELAALQPRIPRLTVRVRNANPKDVDLKIDDLEVPSSLIGVERLTDPGHRIIIARVGNTEARDEANLAEGERKEVMLTFAKQTPVPVTAPPVAQPPTLSPKPMPTEGPTAPEPPAATHGKGQRTLGWIGLGVGRRRSPVRHGRGRHGCHQT